MKPVMRNFIPGKDSFNIFDCGKPDLNNFLHETGDDTPNATKYECEHLSKTYFVEDLETSQSLAYFSLTCDKIERDVSDPAIWNRLSRKIPNAKRRSSYPAIKIGRLAVSQNAQGTGLGQMILSFIKATFFGSSKVGCRFLTVDAYMDAEPFYTKCKFSPLVTPEPDDETVLMFFDLMSLEE